MPIRLPTNGVAAGQYLPALYVKLPRAHDVPEGNIASLLLILADLL
jgi:hypothetical protein